MGEIASSHELSGSNTESNSLNQQYSYNVDLSEMTDFTNSGTSDSSIQIKQRSPVIDDQQQSQDKLFNDDQFHLLAAQIMDEPERPSAAQFFRGTHAHFSNEHVAHLGMHLGTSVTDDYQPFRRSEANNTKNI